MDFNSELGYKALHLAILDKIEESEKLRSIMRQLRNSENFFPKTTDSVKDFPAVTI
jgi:hypothetical protein